MFIVNNKSEEAKAKLTGLKMVNSLEENFVKDQLSLFLKENGIWKNFYASSFSITSVTIRSGKLLIGQVRNARFFSAPGMYPIQWPKQEATSRKKTGFSLKFKQENRKDLQIGRAHV